MRNGSEDGEPARAAGMPRWVKVFGIVTAALVVLIVVLLLVGGHGPGRHLGAGAERADSVGRAGLAAYGVAVGRLR